MLRLPRPRVPKLNALGGISELLAFTPPNPAEKKPPPSIDAIVMCATVIGTTDGQWILATELGSSGTGGWNLNPPSTPSMIACCANRVGSLIARIRSSRVGLGSARICRGETDFTPWSKLITGMTTERPSFPSRPLIADWTASTLGFGGPDVPLIRTRPIEKDAVGLPDPPDGKVVSQCRPLSVTSPLRRLSEPISEVDAATRLPSTTPDQALEIIPDTAKTPSSRCA